MKPRIHVLTLGVDELERALAFYRALGLESTGIVGTEFAGDETTPAGAAAMFELEDGLVLSLYPRTELGKDAGVRADFSIGHIVETREEVDALLARAEAAGATVIGEPHDRPWGIYSGYFRDPAGHLWEVIWREASR